MLNMTIYSGFSYVKYQFPFSIAMLNITIFKNTPTKGDGWSYSIVITMIYRYAQQISSSKAWA